jgi:hypothetical protein
MNQFMDLVGFIMGVMFLKYNKNEKNELVKDKSKDNK